MIDRLAQLPFLGIGREKLWVQRLPFHKKKKVLLEHRQNNLSYGPRLENTSPKKVEVYLPFLEDNHLQDHSPPNTTQTTEPVQLLPRAQDPQNIVTTVIVIGLLPYPQVLHLRIAIPAPAPVLVLVLAPLRKHQNLPPRAIDIPRH